MRVRVLGSMEVRDPDPVRLGGPTQRRTLGMLLVNAGRTVSIDQLVDGIWPDGDTARALQLLDNALALWNGRPTTTSPISSGHAAR